jgi:hypothetical protein
MKTSNSPEGQFAKLVEEFFLDRLIRQRNSSRKLWQPIATAFGCSSSSLAIDGTNQQKGWC